MHIHFHIYAFLHYLRHARLLGSNMRFVGTLLLMLLFSLLQFVVETPASAMFEERENRRIIGFSCDADSMNIRGHAGTAPEAWIPGADREDPVPPAAVMTATHSSVYYRLKPKIVMIPRMNRTPKPKSVYRNFARAPGGAFF